MVVIDFSIPRDGPPWCELSCPRKESVISVWFRIPGRFAASNPGKVNQPNISAPIGQKYRPGFAFLDRAQAKRLGISGNQTDDADFFRGHESSHQWWGHRVGWKKLSRPVAFGRLRRVLRPSLCAVPRKYEGIFNAMASGQAASGGSGFELPQDRNAGPIWIGAADPLFVTNPGSYQNLIYTKGDTSADAPDCN